MNTTAAATTSGHDTTEERSLSRRDFLMWVAAGSISVTGLFALRTLGFVVMPPARSIEGKTKIGPLAVASVDELRPGEPKLVEYGDDFVFLVRTGSDPSGVIALNAACPHVQCKLHFNEQLKRYECPCHASAFSIEGKKLFGPAPRDMVAAVYEIQDGKVVVSGFESV